MLTILDFFTATPEIFVLAMSCFILMLGVLLKKNISAISYCLAQTTLICSALLSFKCFSILHFINIYSFSHTFILDKLAVSLKIFIDIAMIFTFWYARLYNDENKIPENEFYVLGLLATLGMMILVSAANFIILFLGMELMSLPIYAMVALMRGKQRCIEAAMKYFIIGSVATAMLLYGLSLFFGATHSLDLSNVAKIISMTAPSQNLILYFGLVFVIAGIAFKLGAAPFHMWVPDVYDGAPNSITLLISAAPKIAAFGLAIRFLLNATPSLNIQWEHILFAIALLSIAIGNFAAIIQTNIKRLLAYSSIAHIGYMLLGLACGTTRGDAAALFYMTTYALTSLGAFGMIVLLSKAGFDVKELKDFSGLATRSPWLAFMMLLVLFSLAGIPPMVGFIAKVGIIEALMNVHLVWIAVLAIIFAIIGSYYYIRVIKVMYFENVITDSVKITCEGNLIFILSINGLSVLLLGIFPSQLFTLCHVIFS